MRFPRWAKVVLWAEVPLVFLLNIWLTPYAVLVAWGIPILWNRWMEHLEVMEELVYTAPKEAAKEDEEALP